MYQGMESERYFRGVEEIMNGYGGRPHWGKRHFKTAETLAERYPRWDDFQRIRSRLDPEGLFRNDYTDRVLGQVVARLKSTKLWDRSLVIVTADHGISFQPGGQR